MLPVALVTTGDGEFSERFGFIMSVFRWQQR